MSFPDVAPAGTASYASWLANVRSLLAHHRPDIQPSLLDPNSTYQAYQSGMTPQAFAGKAVIPLRAIPTPNVVPSGTSAVQAGGQAVGNIPDSTLVGWMWTLSGIYVGLLFLVGPGAGFLDLPAFLIAIALVLRRGPGAVHGWVKLGLEFSGCIWVMSAARGGY